MRIRIITILAALICGGNMLAQAGFVSVGGDTHNNAGSLSYSIGQLTIGSANAKATAAQCVTASINEGLQQPYRIQELHSPTGEAGIAGITVFPNPTTDGVMIQQNNPDSILTYSLYTVEGRLLQQGFLDDANRFVDMGEYPTGSYLLTISGSQSENKYRIIKAR